MSDLEHRAGLLRQCLQPRHLLLLIATLGFLLSATKMASMAPGVDFFQYWAAPQAVQLEDTNIYRSEDRVLVAREFMFRSQQTSSERYQQAAGFRQEADLNQSPFLYTVFAASVSGDYDRDLSRYRLFSLLCFLVSIAYLCRALGYTAGGTLAAILIFSLGSEPFFSELRVANVNQLQLGTLCFFLWLQSAPGHTRRHVAAGLVLGMAGMFKPNITFAVYLICAGWVVRGDYRKLLAVGSGIAGGAVLATLLAAAFFGGLSCWTDWATSLRLTMAGVQFTLEEGNISLHRLLLETTGIELGLIAALLFTGTATAFLLPRRTWWKEQGAELSPEVRSRVALREEILLVGAGMTLAFAFSRLVWLHYLLLLIPVFLVLLRPIEGDSPRAIFIRGARVALSAVALVGTQVIPLRSVLAEEDKYGMIVASTLLLFVLTMWELAGAPGPRKPRPASRETTT